MNHNNSNGHRTPPWGKFALRMTLARMKAKAGLSRRAPGLLGTREHLLGMEIEYADYDALILLFEEIFVHGDYHFNAGSESPFILDCGSNIGLAALYFKQLYPRARVVAFEPDPVTFAILGKNLKGNSAGDVQAVNCALHGVATRLPFYRDTHRPGAPYASTNPDLVAMVAGNQRVAQGEVQGVRLSDYVDQPVDFLKLDVEGAEGAVIGDLAETGKLRLVRTLVMEYHHHIRADEDRFGELLRLLEQNGFGYQVNAHLPRPFRGHSYQNFLVYAYQQPTAG